MHATVSAGALVKVTTGDQEERLLSPKKKVRGGIDLGGTKIQAVVVDSRHNVLGSARRQTPTEGGPADVVEAMAGALAEAAEAAGYESGELSGIGVGSPGSVDESSGNVSEARNLPDWEGSYPMGDELERMLGARAFVGNDVQVATNAEFKLGAGKPYKSMLGVFWGTGVGGGIILNGREWLGRGAAGEIGHVVVRRGGARCTCGRRGCMEAYAGRMAMEIKARRDHEDGTKTHLFKIMEKKKHDRLTSGVWEDAWKDGDELATHLLERAIAALGTGVASAVNLLDPEAVIFGGGMGLRFFGPYEKALRKEMGKHLFVDDNPPAILPAALGDLGGAIGAALLVKAPKAATTAAPVSAAA
jgi:glucokinase